MDARWTLKFLEMWIFGGLVEWQSGVVGAAVSPERSPGGVSRPLPHSASRALAGSILALVSGAGHNLWATRTGSTLTSPFININSIFRSSTSISHPSHSSTIRPYATYIDHRNLTAVSLTLEVTI